MEIEHSKKYIITEKELKEKFGIEGNVVAAVTTRRKGKIVVEIHTDPYE